MSDNQALYIFTLSVNDTVESYDEAMAATCLQGIINRTAPTVYIVTDSDKRSIKRSPVYDFIDADVNKPYANEHQCPNYWLELFSSEGRWLSGRERKPLADLDALFALAGKMVKGAVIWDPGLPTTLNVATTIAGVEDGVVLSPEFAETYLTRWKLPVLKDLRGIFTGKETGSKKNDAYRWAVREYLAKGACSGHWVCLYEEAFLNREVGDIAYAVTRDWAIANRSFVYDLSPWGDEPPLDDLDQKLGTDLETHNIILGEVQKLNAGTQMTEIVGFGGLKKYSKGLGMHLHRSRHSPWETEHANVRLFSPYNCYQNTIASDCYNQSLHRHAPSVPLKQHRPKTATKSENKTYLCIHMADFDSATTIYDYIPKLWTDKRRGAIPLMWGINPNLVETYPDIIEYLYQTSSENDYFAADASCAGYINPNLIKKEQHPLFIRHNQKFYNHLDMTLSPMVLDVGEPSANVKDAYAQFSMDGFGSIHGPVEPHVWKGMPVMKEIGEASHINGAEKRADVMSSVIPAKKPGKPAFHLFRIVWVSPGNVIDAIELLKQKRPELDIEVVDPFNFFRMFKEYYAQNKYVPEWPGKGVLDGAARIVDGSGFIFLFNPSRQTGVLDFDMTESIGISENCGYRIMEAYPGGDACTSIAYGDSIKVELERYGALLLNISKCENYSGDQEGAGKPLHFHRIRRINKGWEASGLFPLKDIVNVGLPPEDTVFKLLRPLPSLPGFAYILDIHKAAEGLIYIRTGVEMPLDCDGRLLYCADGPVKVWVNGAETACVPNATNPAFPGDKYNVSCRWVAGRNEIIFALNTNNGTAWGVYAGCEY